MGKTYTCCNCGDRCSDIVFYRNWSHKRYNYCWKCQHMDKNLKSEDLTKPPAPKTKGKKKKKDRRPLGICENCNATYNKPFPAAKICHDCYGRQKAAEKKLEQALNTQLKLQEAPLTSPEPEGDQDA